jgi:hypothetical protein
MEYWRKGMRISRRLSIYALFVSLVFIGCATLETSIPNGESYAQVIPIQRKSTFLFFGEKFLLNNYELRYIRDIDFSVEIVFFTREWSGRRYDFSKDGQKLYTIDIITSTRNIRNENTAITINPEMYIRIYEHNGSDREEFKVDFDRRQPYIQFNDNTMGNIKFDYYKSRNRNTPDYAYETLTGFKIYAEDEEFGLLAFFPSSLHLKNNVNIDDKMAVYIMSTYASFLYNEFMGDDTEVLLFG